MSHEKMGGPAFPFQYHNQTRSYQEGFFGTGQMAPGEAQQFSGMTLWDYYAAAALPAVINGVINASSVSTNDGQPVTEAHIALQTAEFADSMLAERAKRMEES